jgi:hypothetical protein
MTRTAMTVTALFIFEAPVGRAVWPATGCLRLHEGAAQTCP